MDERAFPLTAIEAAARVLHQRRGWWHRAWNSDRYPGCVKCRSTMHKAADALAEEVRRGEAAYVDYLNDTL